MTHCQLYLIRHGETLWNLEGRFQGQLDSALSPEGQRQASALAQHFLGIPLDGVYSSDLGRAVATTSGIAESQGLDLILDEGLRERSFGIFEGLLRSEAEELNAEAFRRWTSGSFTEAVPGGESRKDLCERILEVLKMLAKTHQGQSIAVTTHGGVLASLWRYLEPKREESRGFSIPNGSISHIKVSSAGDWEVVQWSSVDHL